jgi:hypothetical protein
MRNANKVVQCKYICIYYLGVQEDWLIEDKLGLSQGDSFGHQDSMPAIRVINSPPPPLPTNKNETQAHSLKNNTSPLNKKRLFSKSSVAAQEKKKIQVFALVVV